MSRFALLFIGLTVLFSVNATDQDLLNTISKSRVWLKLLHFSSHTKRSEIENSEFFLAKDGNREPFNELIATINAFSLPVDNQNPNTHAQCRYPARLLFLQKQGLHTDFPQVKCENYLGWRGKNPPDSISVIYADGYLGNPASFYGHILFKVGSTQNDFTSDLLNNSLNFGAQVPDDENPVAYILKGLIGGYQAKYTSNHFYRYNINYSEVELRDLWQYQLNLSTEKKDLLVAHAWELLSSGYTYFFTHRNCAYHIAKMLELVTSVDLISPLEPFVLPITVFNRLAKINDENGSLIQVISRTESRQNRFRRKYIQLQPQQKSVIRALIETGEYNASYYQLTETEQKRLLDVVIDYYEFRMRQDESQPKFKKHKNRALIERLKLTAGSNPNWASSEAIQPHLGQNPSLIRTSLQHNSITGSSASIQVRPAYFDYLSTDAGHLPFSQLSMLDLSIRFDHEQAKVERFDLVNIETLNISATGLPGDAGLAWKVRLGNERDVLSDSKISNEYFVEAAIGKAIQVGKLALYTMFETRWQSPNDKSEQLLLSPKVGFIYSEGNWKVHCHASYPMQIDQTPERSKLRSTCTQRLAADYWYDLRIKIQKHFSHEIGLSFSYYL